MHRVASPGEPGGCWHDSPAPRVMRKVKMTQLDQGGFPLFLHILLTGLASFVHQPDALMVSVIRWWAGGCNAILTEPA